MSASRARGERADSVRLTPSGAPASSVRRYTVVLNVSGVPPGAAELAPSPPAQPIAPTSAATTAGKTATANRCELIAFSTSGTLLGFPAARQNWPLSALTRSLQALEWVVASLIIGERSLTSV